MMKSEPFYGMRYLQGAAMALAVLFSVALLLAAAIEVVQMFQGLLEFNITAAIQDGLFTLILLEMFYVVRSFIKYGSVNTALIISVGIVAIVKEVIFRINSLSLESAIAYTVLFLAFCIGFLIENRSYQFSIERGEKPRSVRKSISELMAEKSEKSEEDQVISEPSR